MNVTISNYGCLPYLSQLGIVCSQHAPIGWWLPHLSQRDILVWKHSCEISRPANSLALTQGNSRWTRVFDDGPLQVCYVVYKWVDPISSSFVQLFFLFSVFTTVKEVALAYYPSWICHFNGWPTWSWCEPTRSASPYCGVNPPARPAHIVVWTHPLGQPILWCEPARSASPYCGVNPPARPAHIVMWTRPLGQPIVWCEPTRSASPYCGVNPPARPAHIVVWTHPLGQPILWCEPARSASPYCGVNPPARPAHIVVWTHPLGQPILWSEPARSASPYCGVNPPARPAHIVVWTRPLGQPILWCEPTRSASPYCGVNPPARPAHIVVWTRPLGQPILWSESRVGQASNISFLFCARSEPWSRHLAQGGFKNLFIWFAYPEWALISLLVLIRIRPA